MPAKKYIDVHVMGEIKNKIKGFCDCRKNANYLIDIISMFEREETDLLLVIIRGVHTIFVGAISNKDMYFKQLTDDVQNTDDKYKIWLRERYEDVKGRLLDMLLHSDSNVQELSLCTMLKFVEAEGHTPLREITGNHLYFPVSVFQPVLSCLVSSSKNQCSLISRFQEYLEYDDIRYFTMKLALKDLKAQSPQDLSDVYLTNMYTLLENLSMPVKPPGEGEHLCRFISKAPENADNLKITMYKEHKKLFTTLWLEFMKTKLPASLYKKVLLILHDKVIPHMTSPLLLSDFLTESYNIGGAISLLALNGLFLLVNSHNLNYPDFYEKLYALLDPSIFHVKYKARFFFLTDLFLTSTHLPAYLVAAFAKKLSRLALTAPSSGLLIILPFIHNLLTRHSSCQVLMHRPESADLDSDPFLMEEKDLSKCKALDSSLWEIQTLRSHFYPSVAIEAKKFDHKLNEKEIDLGPLLETTMDDLLQNEMKKKVKDIPLTFEAPKSLFAAANSKDNTIPELWILS